MTNPDTHETYQAGDPVWIPENRSGKVERRMANVDRVEGDAVYLRHESGNITGPHSAWSIERAEVPR